MVRPPAAPTPTPPLLQPPVRPKTISPSERAWQIANATALRRACFPVAVVFVFLRFSFLHEVLAFRFGSNLYPLLIVGTVAIFGAIFSGGMQRTLHSRAAQCWALFTLWMLLDVPFSNWKSDSLKAVFQYARVNLVMLLILAGFAITLRECYLMMSAIALAAVVNMLSASEFIGDGSRLDLNFGSIANSNDFAAHMLLVLPFLLWMGLSSRFKLLRVVALILVPVGVLVGARTGSRGAMLALGAAAIFLVLRARGALRILFLATVPILVLAIVLYLPQSIKDRYKTTFHEDKAGPTNEAEASSEARRYLLTTSLDLTRHNPLFGVGPNEFLITEGNTAQSQGRHGAWQVTHNAYMQVASEDGIPALLFFLAAIILTFRMLNRVYQKAAPRRDLRRAQLAALCIMLSMIGFGVAIFFLSLSYSMYLPAMTGLAIALDRATDHELKSVPAAA
jgi:O-antigen ligase